MAEGYPQLSDHLGLQIACKLEGAGVTESEKGILFMMSHHKKYHACMTSIEINRICFK